MWWVLDDSLWDQPLAPLLLLLIGVSTSRYSLTTQPSQSSLIPSAITLNTCWSQPTVSTTLLSLGSTTILAQSTLTFLNWFHRRKPPRLPGGLPSFLAGKMAHPSTDISGSTPHMNITVGFRLVQSTHWMGPQLPLPPTISQGQGGTIGQSPHKNTTRSFRIWRGTNCGDTILAFGITNMSG